MWIYNKSQYKIGTNGMIINRSNYSERIVNLLQVSIQTSDNIARTTLNSALSLELMLGFRENNIQKFYNI